jgi:hypothetical protein
MKDPPCGSMWYGDKAGKLPQFKRSRDIVLMTSFAAQMPYRRFYGQEAVRRKSSVFRNGGFPERRFCAVWHSGIGNHHHGQGFGFLELATQQEATSAIAKMNGCDMDGRTLKVSEAQPKAPRDGAGPGRGQIGSFRQ